MTSARSGGSDREGPAGFFGLFVRSFGGLLSFGPTLRYEPPRLSVEDALRGDMERVGADLRRVMDKHPLG